MANIVDRRTQGKNKLAGSRKKFLNKYKKQISEAISEHIKDKDITKMKSKVKVKAHSIDEVRASYDGRKSRRKNIHPGNDKYVVGDSIPINGSEEGDSGSGGGDGEDYADVHEFVLSKKEVVDLIFRNMRLPNFIKKSNKNLIQTRFTTGGYVKEGPISRLAIKKTFEQAVARKIAAKSSNTIRHIPFIDDIDLRFRNLIKEEKPISQAVVFFVLDVSGSMYEDIKLMAKKFFMFFYWFLELHYKYLDLRFIIHTTDAYEVGEKDFFTTKISGGTVLSSGLRLISDIIKAEYNYNDTNIYIVQASDGENFYYDDAQYMEEINKLLKYVQYYMYVETRLKPSHSLTTYKLLLEHFMGNEKVGTSAIFNDADIIRSLQRELEFERI